jgi:Tfp pilus assembly protein PilF
MAALFALAFAFAFALAGCGGELPLPRQALALNAAGAQSLAQGDLSAAEARLSVALEYSPRFVEAWVNLGYVELRRGNFEQARRDFVKARSLNEDIPAPHHALGVLADEQGDGEAAEQAYRRAIGVDPGFAPARANLARRLFARGQYENAREQFQRLRGVAPDAVEGWAGEAESLLELGREQEAEQVVAAARARLGDAPAILLLVGRVLLARGDYDGGEAVLAHVAADRDRTRAGVAWAWIAVARAGRGDVDGTRAAATAALAVDRGDPVARYALRVVLECPSGCRPAQAPDLRLECPSGCRPAQAPDLSEGTGTPSPRGSR